MTAKQINDTIKEWLPYWDRDNDENNEENNIAFIQGKIDGGILVLYDAMRNDLGVMADYGDDETGLLYELITADADEITTYKETFL